MTVTARPQILGNGNGLQKGKAGQLPLNLTPLVGRRQQVAELRRQLSDCRLVTLLGPGGVGKTRLAAETAKGAQEGGLGESHWAELAPVSSDLVELAVADALGVHEGLADSALGAVVEAVGSRRVLLVLDNAEHLVGTVATLSVQLLASCSGLPILATSREPLASPAPGLPSGPWGRRKCGLKGAS